jgi:hypothetical protein
MDTSQTPPNELDKPAGPLELVADPSRQAMPLFKGIDYQIWQTVLAWMDLGENESLDVEGAEDFDNLSETSATINQVKNLASPISLRSECVCDALRNFWIARHKNPGRAIRFRLITTATLSIEAGAPFGASKLGLAVWNEEAAKATAQHSQHLIAFLLSDASISERLAKAFAEGIPSLVEHLRQLSSEAFHSEFVCAIQWLPQQPDVDVVREMVWVRLHAYGEDKHLLPRDSERALTPLFEYVAHVAIRQRRLLTREDFRVLFDDSTRVNVPVSQFNQMQAAVALLQPAFASTTQVTFLAAETASIPDLPIPCALRSESVDTLAKCVSENRFVAIQGSTRKGKSTLAKLLARKLAGHWVWTSFADRSPQQISEELYRLAHQAAVQPHAASLFLDDFNPSGSDLPPLFKKLAVLSRLTLAGGGRMIVTTQRLLGEAFLRQSDLPPQVLQQVAAFREEEVQELCVRSACPQDERLPAWVKIISSQTGCHPQLVHARVKVASRRGWPEPSVSDVLEIPREITDERQLARQLLQELDDSEIELLYRLSLASQPFRKDQVVAVGAIAPPISRPGDKFDALVGPWIEPVGKRYYRLSQLLARIGEDNWTPEHARSMRIEYARAIHRTHDRTLLEASEILFQSVLTKDAALAGPVLASLVLAPLKSREIIAQWLGWILVLTEPSSIFPDNQFVSHVFALVQFRVAAASQAASAATFAERLFKEAHKSVAPEIDNYRAMGAAADIILAMQVLVVPRLLLQAWLDVRRLAGEDKRLGKVAHLIEKRRPKTRHVFPQQTFEELLFSFVLSRRGGSGYLRRFVSAVDGLSLGERQLVISAINADRFILLGFVDDAWMHELTNEKPDWDEAIAALEETRRAGERWGLAELSMMAARGIAVVQDEHLQNRDEALKVLADTAAAVGDGIWLRYQRGTVNYLAKNYTAAYEAWSSTFDSWPTNDEIGAVYACFAFSGCGAAAGFLEKWEDAMVAFRRGQALAVKVDRRLDALKFGIDAAYAQWKAGFRKEALGNLAQHLSEMERLSRTDKSTEFHTTWKVMEHIIVWCKSDTGAPGNLEMITPRPGICSEAKSKEKYDLVKDAPRAPALVSWYCLAEAELYAGLGNDIYRSIVARRDVSDYPNLRPIFDFLRAQRALADREFKAIPVFAESSALAFSRVAAQSLDERTLIQHSRAILPEAGATPSTASFVEESLLCALLVASAEDIPWEALLNQWRTAVTQMRSPTILTAAIETIERICNSTPMAIYRQLAASTFTRFSQVVAGLQLVVHPETKPALCYVGLCGLVTDAGFATNMMFSHDALAKLTQRAWLARLSAPFELCSPRVTVPAIRSACESKSKGLALAATILLAAGHAVNVRKLANIQKELQTLAAVNTEGAAPA